MAAEPFASIDALFTTELDARAVNEALRMGWIDALATGPRAPADLPGSEALSPVGLTFLLGVLRANSVLEGTETLALTARFRRILAARDLLEARLWFLLAVAPDLHERFALFLSDPGAFVASASVFEVFDYSHALATDQPSLERTARWVRYTTALTRYEAPLIAHRLGLEASARLLDVGGNSGEFALCCAARHPGLQAVVADLPGVCVLGQRNIAGRPGADRVAFAPLDLRSDPLPGGVDTLVFKSVLHDWPEDMAALYLEKAAEALLPGGRLIIVERAPVPPPSGPMPFASLANLVFLPFFRPAADYARLLPPLGFAIERSETLMLDMDFHLIIARKGWSR